MSTTPHKAAGVSGSLAALGVVFGDIGTSPLYAMRETLEGPGHVLDVSEANVLGVLSLITWSLIVVIAVKYLLFVMRADNDGEGGILALTSLLIPGGGRSTTTRRGRLTLILIGLFGTALLYGDGMITPAISVLSAVEGTAVATESLEAWVEPIAMAILVGIFAVQSRGTASIGRVFGPVMVVWFTVLGGLGIAHVIDEPGVLRAIDPTHGVRFFLDNGTTGFLALGSIFLVVTGGEALYADMGHFGRRPITRGWFFLVLPGLLLNYYGQGALLIGEPDAVENPFYRMVPQSAVLPLVILATMATIIASQALISGAFSLTLQAVRLGYVPRLRIVHTSDEAQGQIYIPAVNWALLVACLGLVAGFRSSTALAAAYGVAVTLTMIITTLLFAVVAREHFGWSRGRVGVFLCGFLVIDLAFFGANAFKIPDGGWFPLVVGAVVFTLLTTWRSGRRILAERITGTQLPLDVFVRDVVRDGPIRVPGTAVFLFSVPGMTPPALVANHRANHVLHERVVIVSVVTDDVPRVLPARRSEVTARGDGVHSVVLHFGFMERPDVVLGLSQGPARKLAVDPTLAIFFLGSESLVVTDRPGMAGWRERLFTLMSRNATPASNHFGLPPDRISLVGTRIEL